jgi:hypothetical protein
MDSLISMPGKASSGSEGDVVAETVTPSCGAACVGGAITTGGGICCGAVAVTGAAVTCGWTKGAVACPPTGG